MEKDQLDIYGIAQKFWRHRMLIMGITFAFTLAGTAFAFLASPRYKSLAIISPKGAPTAGGASALLSQLGGMGGMVASQLGIGMQGGPEKLELVLESTDLAMTVVERYNLLPKLFPNDWDEKKGEWKEGIPGGSPSVRSGARFLAMNILNVEADIKKGIVSISATTRDSTLAMEIVRDYLAALNIKVKEDARNEADSNISYLEAQSAKSLDPSVREKIQSLIAMEIDKATFLSSKGFDIIDKPRIPDLREWPKRGVIISASLFLGLFASLILVLAKIGLTEFRKNRPA